MTKLRWHFLALLLLGTWSATVCCANRPADDQAEPGRALPAPHLNRLFQRTSGWTGADGASSVPLTDTLTLWLFGDTFIGRVYDGARAKTTLINNSVALQVLRRDRGGEIVSARPRFYWKTARDQSQHAKLWQESRFERRANGDKPTSFFLPPDRKGWFWPLSGVLADNALFVVLLQLDKTDETSVFGFRTIGLWLARVSNPLSSPSDWVVSYRRVPWCLTGTERQVTFGSAIMKDGDAVYVYGIDEDLRPGKAQKSLIVARAPMAGFDRFSAWRFWNGTAWGANFTRSAAIAEGLVDEFSVSRLPGTDRLVLVQTEPGLSPRIVARMAGAPQGPWSTPRPVYTVPEASGSKRLFAYAAKAHPELATQPHALVLTYVVNSFDFFDLIKQANLYWPTFLQLRIDSRS
ncbi:MAG TPA: DUF4185 domain-containing protein [Candidatus Ozemobacteraceae bacterium]|nr:DUF4185 domain-containing protein [Candidatus Ozemobacteraceae bacterium]